ncbi:MAG: ATP-binding protein [Opitutales bacterium]
MISLRRQLTREFLAAFAALLGVALLGLYGIVWVELTNAFDAAMESRALAVSSLVEQENGRLEVDFSESVLRGFAAERARYYFELRNGTGALVARSSSLGTGELPQPRRDRAVRKPVYWNLPLPNGRPGRAISILFTPKTGADKPRLQPADMAELIVAVSRKDLNETLAGLLAAVAGCGLLLFVAILWVVPRVLRRGLAPLERLGEHAAGIDAGSLAERFPLEGLPAELKPICERLNDLLARLEKSFERERRFSADLAHELRTPLAELRNLAECALKWPEAREAGCDQDTLEIALQLETLVTRLLMLARGERGQLAVQGGPLDLAAQVDAAWQPFATRAADRGLKVQFSVTPATAQADPVLLHSILSNLFDNAVDYAPEGGEIAVTGDAAGRLRVANQAAGVAEADLACFFDRFWRKESARSGGVHVGLGLNLARTFATAMGWRLAVALEGGWVVFTLNPGGG